MNDKFDNQNETLISLSHEISLLQQQVKYLLRNKKAAELLDLDVLMNRTHTIYDMICSISINENEEEQDFDIDPEALTALFGGISEAEDEHAEETTEDEIEPDTERPTEEAVEEETIEDQDENVEAEEMPKEEEENEPEDLPETEEKLITEDEPVAEEEPMVEEQAQQDEQAQEGDDFGYFFRFEDIPLKHNDDEDSDSFDSEHQEETNDIVEEIDGKTVHFMEEVSLEEIPENDRIAGENLVPDDPFKMPGIENEPLQYGGFFEKDDMGFEIGNNETLGEHMMADDKSLHARFQHGPLNDLKSAIGLNDKFLFVNELFGGSMEKFNKSIENLNDLKTLNGAMIYLNELKVELQWNSSNEAYKKLWTLVAQKFDGQ